jgi:uncharacterized protein YneF (UPF0154 family)
MEIIFNLFSSLGGLTPIIIIGGIYLYYKQSKAQEYDIPPLDLVDAKKIDDMVSKKVEDVLRPMLQSRGYNEEQINQILTRTALGGSNFRR